MSSPVPLNVKWGKQTIEIQLDPAIGVKGLKSELQEKTNVPIERQKILAKSKGLWKGVLKDDVDLSTVDWKAALAKSNNTLQVLLMGSADEIKAPTVKTVFVEDLPEEEKAKVAEPAGLVNLGNTCYLNSVVQCLRAVPTFTDQLALPAPTNNSTAAANPSGPLFVRALSDTFRQLKSQTTAVQPVQLVRSVQLAFPQFAQLTRDGRPMQQDAEEFYSGLMALVPDSEQFSFDLAETLTCEEAPSEPAVVKRELHRKLVCNIGADSSHIQEGIMVGLRGQIEKHSAVLGRDAMWTREQRIAKLPQILTVQFGRFFWKATPDSQDHQGVKCKIMKPMAFNDVLDVYTFCSEEIQAILKVSRAKALKEEEDAIERKLKGETEPMETEESKTPAADAATASAMQVDDAEDADELKAALAMSMEATNDDLGPGIPAQFQGYYELFAVVTHKGRDADGGHYMAWVKSEHQQESQKIADSDALNEDWYVYDDDSVSPCKTEDVLKLKGGGDWHMSYLNFYRLKK